MTSEAVDNIHDTSFKEKCSIDIHEFSETILNEVVNFQVFSMQDSFYLWVGTSPCLNNLCVAMCTKFVSIFFNFHCHYIIYICRN